jgi:hypothetical protein
VKIKYLSNIIMNFDRNCKYIVEDYLLGKSALYQSRGALSILVTLLILGCTNYLKLSKNPYVNQLVTTFILMMILVTVVARMMISQKEKDELKNKCKMWVNDPNTIVGRNATEVPIDMNAVSKYDGNIEGWYMINGKEQVKERFELKDPDMPQRDSSFVISDTQPNINIDNTVLPQDNLVNGHQIYSATPVGLNMHVEKLKDINDIKNETCLMGDACGALCSGTGINSCGVVAPVPGPQWQPQTAAVVQNRLNNGVYVPAKCPQDGSVLRRAQNCNNINEGAGCGPSQSACVSAPIVNQ